ITQRGYGKRTPLAEYPVKHRAGQGVFTLKVTDRVGKLTALRVVSDPEEEVLVISASGMVLRTPVGAISRIGRQTQGVIVMRLARHSQDLSARLAAEQSRLHADVERLREALAETAVLWQPYGRLLRWLSHPLAIALMQSYARRRAAR